MAAIHSSTNSKSHHGRVHGAKTGGSKESLVQNDPYNTSGSSPTEARKRTRPDFLLSHDSALSTVWLLTPLSPDAHRFIADHIDESTVLYFGSSVVVVQHYVENLLRGIAEAGLAVARG